MLYGKRHLVPQELTKDLRKTGSRNSSTRWRNCSQVMLNLVLLISIMKSNSISIMLVKLETLEKVKLLT